MTSVDRKALCAGGMRGLAEALIPRNGVWRFARLSAGDMLDRRRRAWL